jgi:hypothetical protein
MEMGADEAWISGEWARVNREVDEVVAERPQEYDPGTLSNLAELLELLRSTRRPAPSISSGYWPTFCVTWGTAVAPNFEIEVFDDRYEVYRLSDGKTDIRYEYHSAGQPIAATLIAELPSPL